MRGPGSKVYVGTAGWSLGRPHAELFPSQGSHLVRYASRLNAAEINSSFYRPHRRSTYQRWAGSVPTDFRFSVKVPKSITHECRLADCDDHLTRFLAEVEGLGEKLGALLVQLPPSFEFDQGVATNFFSAIRRRSDSAIACEPRHLSWFDETADKTLADCGVARVAADPPVCGGDVEPGGDTSWAYYRWHGSPLLYRSSYGVERLAPLSDNLAGSPVNSSWCIFDNTLGYAAATDALILERLIRRRRPQSIPVRTMSSG